MTALWTGLACWLALCVAFVALRLRATAHRPAPVRRPLRATQLRALRARTANMRTATARATAAGATAATAGASARRSGALLVAGPRR
jgi:hypothetical protein